jgi:hypothetical protein
VNNDFTVPLGPNLRIAMLDRDSRDDIVTVGPGGSNAQDLLIFLSNGDGTFRKSPGDTIPAGIDAIAAADFTSDGIVDLVVTNFTAMYFLRGRGDGTFESPAPFVFQANQPTQQQVIASADLNRDGKRDLLTCGNFCSVRLGNGDGTFQEQRIDAIRPGFRYLLADFDNDGQPDIAVLSGDRVELFLNRGK